MGIFWGFVLVWAGLAYLGASFGWWDYSKAAELWLYWPLALIFGGLSVLLRGRKFGWAILTSLLLVMTFIIYDLSFASRPLVFNDGWRSQYGQGGEVREEGLSTDKDARAKDIKYKIRVGAIRADISGITAKALDGNFVSSVMGIRKESSLYGETQLIELTNEGQRGPVMWFGRKVENRLSLSFSSELPISLEADCGASELNFDLSEYILRRVQLSAGASNIRLKIGEKTENGARVAISSGASAIKIELPKSLGVRIKSDDGLSSNTFAGFVKDGEYHKNEGYDTATQKIDIVLQTGVSSVEVVQY
jgi:hypothetical protein